MTTAQSPFETFCALVKRGETVTAIERFYAEDVTIFENRALARAGRDACLRYERDALQAQPTPPRITIHAAAFDPRTQVGFIEYDIRFASPTGRPMRLQETVVQQWSRGHIDSERYYYEGLVDEGDEGDGTDGA